MQTTPTTHALARVLVVEDEPKLRQSLVEGLSLEDWWVTGTENGADAWRQIESQLFDLIVLDRMLPDCDGIELVRCLREARRDTPILLITARDGTPDRDAARHAGVTDFLPKPFSFENLIKHARALLGAAK